MIESVRQPWRRGLSTASLALMVLVGTLALAAPLPSAAATVSTTAGVATSRKVSAWLPWWDQARAYQSFLDNADLYSSVSPFWYEMASSTSVTQYPNAEDTTVLAGIRSRGVAVIPTVSNDFDPTRVNTMLATSSSRTAHVTVLVNLVNRMQYDGIDIDYENLVATDRDLYSAFISQLASALHASGRTLTVAVHPKTSEPGSWSGPQAQNYEAIGASADRVRVMAYDYHWNTSGPGPVAPLYWVDQVAAFAASQIPPSKIELGVPLYGYDWVGMNGEGLTYDMVMARRLQHGAALQWSTPDSAPWFTYSTNGVSHTVWFEDSSSVAAKLAVVDKYGLAGAAFWRLGGEDPRVWESARTRWVGVSAPADTTPPTTPSSLTAASTVRTRVTLTWAASTDTGGSGMAGYQVFRSRSASGPFTQVATTASAGYSDTAVARRTTYWYSVRAVDGAGNVSPASGVATATTR